MVIDRPHSADPFCRSNTDMARNLKLWFLSKIYSRVYSLFSKTESPPSPTTLLTSVQQLEMVAGTDHHSLAAPTGVAWENIMVAFCLESALEVATLSIQSGSDSHFSLTIQLFSLVILLAFICLCFGKFAGKKYPVISTLLGENLSRFLVATAFVLAITVPFPLWLKYTSWTIYALLMLAIMIFNYF